MLQGKNQTDVSGCKQMICKQMICKQIITLMRALICRICGVMLENGAQCMRTIDCKAHTKALKSEVPGRTRPYDDVSSPVCVPLNSCMWPVVSRVRRFEMIPQCSVVLCRFEIVDVRYFHSTLLCFKCVDSRWFHLCCVLDWKTRDDSFVLCTRFVMLGAFTRLYFYEPRVSWLQASVLSVSRGVTRTKFCSALHDEMTFCAVADRSMGIMRVQRGLKHETENGQQKKKFIWSMYHNS